MIYTVPKSDRLGLYLKMYSVVAVSATECRLDDWEVGLLNKMDCNARHSPFIVKQLFARTIVNLITFPVNDKRMQRDFLTGKLDN